MAAPSEDKREDGSGSGSETGSEEDEENDMYIDRKGFVHCFVHRREACDVCCIDNRITNALHKLGPDYTEEQYNAVCEENERMQEAEHAAVLAGMAEHRKNHGNTSTRFELGSDEWHKVSEGLTTLPPTGTCLNCMSTPKKLQQCARCRVAKYCNSECQKEHWPQHKQSCTRQPEPPQELSFASIDEGKREGVLQLRVMQVLPQRGTVLTAKDRKGAIRPVAFDCANPPPGLAAGKILEWRNPPATHNFPGGRGLRCQDADVANIDVKR
jgi:MYND finger